MRQSVFVWINPSASSAATNFRLRRKGFRLCAEVRRHEPAWQANRHEIVPPFALLAAADRSQSKLIIILVCADPEPVVMAISLASESAIASTDLGGVNAAFFAET